MRNQILHTYEKTYSGGYGYALFKADKSTLEVFRFGHDSTSDMDNALDNSLQHSPLWEGSIVNLLNIIIERRDIYMPARKIINSDFDNSIILDFYLKIEEWGIENKYLAYNRNKGGQLTVTI